jgi:tetratricopeptide (TPR) repeat protein
MFVRHRSWPCALLLVAAVARPAAAAFTNDPKLAAAIERGRRLSDDAAKQLEASLALHPDDVGAHAQLIGYFYDRAAAAPQRRLAQVVWMIRHRPADPLTPAYGPVNPLSDGPGYAAASAAWDEQVSAHPTDTAVLADAAAFFDNGTDTPKAQDLLRRAIDAEPRVAAWPARLARSLERQADRQPDQAAVLCNQALALRQMAYKLTPDRADRFHVLTGTPMDAYRGGDLISAKRFASDLLQAADDFPDDPGHGEAVHKANIVLGEVALHSGNTDRAEEYLAAAAKVSSSPALATAGPDVGLAKELLAKGERTPVRDYLLACQSWWTAGHDRLARWVATLDAGGTPDWGS